MGSVLVSLLPGPGELSWKHGFKSTNTRSYRRSKVGDLASRYGCNTGELLAEAKRWEEHYLNSERYKFCLMAIFLCATTARVQEEREGERGGDNSTILLSFCSTTRQLTKWEYVTRCHPSCLEHTIITATATVTAEAIPKTSTQQQNWQQELGNEAYWLLVGLPSAAAAAESGTVC